MRSIFVFLSILALSSGARASDTIQMMQASPAVIDSSVMTASITREFNVAERRSFVLKKTDRLPMPVAQLDSLRERMAFAPLSEQ